ncbi:MULTISPECIES: hypothetical protein [Clostridium]|uniref:hypothetical protein n=1 Tax=Clostridium TaxID=1485 RepID=UPI0008240E0E|nr:MULTISPECIES: hypothetical protein [Clostridium]PJI06544.1 hypothetical protein CUB90_01095 [Clostridium sp. CT7]
MEYIKNELNKKGIKFKEVEIGDELLYIVIYYNGRIFFIKNLNGLYPDSLLDDSIFISDYVSSEKIEKQLNDKDKKNIFSDINLMAILWELYIVGIHLLDDKNTKYRQEEISKVEKDKFIARKIIIENSDKTKIIQELIDILEPSKKLEEIITVNEELSPQGIWNNISKIDDINSIKIKNVNDLNSLEKYLDKVKTNVDELNKKLDGGEYFEN